MVRRGPAGNGGFKLLQPRRADFEQQRSKSVVCGKVKVGRRRRSPMQNQLKHLKHIDIYVYEHIYVYACLHMYMCMHTYMYADIHVHTNMQTYIYVRICL